MTAFSSKKAVSSDSLRNRRNGLLLIRAECRGWALIAALVRNLGQGGAFCALQGPSDDWLPSLGCSGRMVVRAATAAVRVKSLFVAAFS